MRYLLSSLCLLAATVSASGWAKGPMLNGTYREADGSSAALEIKFGTFNLPGTTTRIQSCNFHFGCLKPDVLTGFNPFNKQNESYLRNWVFTGMRYQERHWEIDYAFVDTNGAVVPVGTLSVAAEGSLAGPDSVRFRVVGRDQEVVLVRISD